MMAGCYWVGSLKQIKEWRARYRAKQANPIFKQPATSKGVGRGQLVRLQKHGDSGERTPFITKPNRDVKGLFVWFLPVLDSFRPRFGSIQPERSGLLVPINPPSFGLGPCNLGNDVPRRLAN